MSTVGAQGSGAIALSAVAVGVMAVGALALGALAIGRLAVGRLSVRSSRVQRLEIDELKVRRLLLGPRHREGHVDYRLSVVRVFVTDWERAIRFYSETLEMAVAVRNDEMGWAQMATGEGQLALERVDASDPEGRRLVGRFVGVSLEVPDIFATYKTLAGRGVKFVGPPERQPWGGLLAHLRDPDGNVLTLLACGN